MIKFILRQMLHRAKTSWIYKKTQKDMNLTHPTRWIASHPPFFNQDRSTHTKYTLWDENSPLTERHFQKKLIERKKYFSPTLNILWTTQEFQDAFPNGRLQPSSNFPKPRLNTPSNPSSPHKRNPMFGSPWREWPRLFHLSIW